MVAKERTRKEPLAVATSRVSSDDMMLQWHLNAPLKIASGAADNETLMRSFYDFNLRQKRKKLLPPFSLKVTAFYTQQIVNAQSVNTLPLNRHFNATVVRLDDQ